MKLRTESLYWLIVAALALLAGLIVFNATSVYGIGLSQDSVVYTAMAESFLAGDGLRSFDGNLVTMWPPLYPLILAFFSSLFDTDVLVVARVFNVVLASLIVLLTGIYARQCRISSLPALGAVAMAAWAFPLVAVRIMAWTEPLFITLVLIAVIGLNDYIANRRIHGLVLFAVAAGLAAVTRYIGVIIIPVGVLVFLLFSQGRWPRRFAFAAALGFVAAIPLALVFANNWLTSRTLMGNRHPPTIPLIDNIKATATVIASWFLPSSLADMGFVVLVGVLLTQLLAVAVFLQQAREQEETTRLFRRYVPTVLFIVAYVAFLLFSTTTTNLNEVNDRYLIPVFIPLMIVVFGSVSVIMATAQYRLKHKSLILVPALLIALLLLWPLRVSWQSMQHWRENGEGFIAAIWERNETMNYLKDNPALVAGQPIYSNYPHVIYAHFRQPTQSIPYHYYVGSTRVLRELSQLKGNWPSSEAVIIWFNWGDWQTHLFRPEELSTISDMTPVTTTADGAIWEATPLP